MTLIREICHFAGAAFDLPEDVAKQLLAAVDELTTRGITLDQPDSLPAEQMVRFVVVLPLLQDTIQPRD